MSNDLELEELFVHFPVFKNHLPLAVGINKELFEHPILEVEGISNVRIRKLLYKLCHSEQYLASLAVEGAERYTLYGEVQEPVSAKDRARALKQLKSKQNRKQKGKARGKTIANKAGTKNAIGLRESKVPVTYKKCKTLVLPNSERGAS